MLQFDQFVGQQAQRPLGLAFGRRATRQGNEVRFGGAVQFVLVLARGGFGPQGRFQSFFHKALAYARHRRRMHFQRLPMASSLQAVVSEP
jgi:hypothetical protein